MISSIIRFAGFMAGLPIRRNFARDRSPSRLALQAAFLQDQSAPGVAGYPDSLPAVLDRQDGREAAFFSGFSASVCQLRRRAGLASPSKAQTRRCRRKFRINYLATETDRSAFIDGIKILRKILSAPALKPYTIEEVDPGAKVLSDEELLNYCRRTGSTVYHPTSTCRMGNDPLAVVDQRLRVRGIEGLRVSMLDHAGPDVGQYQCPTIMIAEKPPT